MRSWVMKLMNLLPNFNEEWSVSPLQHVFLLTCHCHPRFKKTNTKALFGFLINETLFSNFSPFQKPNIQIMCICQICRNSQFSHLLIHQNKQEYYNEQDSVAKKLNEGRQKKL